jgi:hypothetical protein
MADVKVSGRMVVSTLQKSFFKEFGLRIRVYDGSSFAESSLTLAQVRKKKGSSDGLSIARNVKIGNLENKFDKEFGIKIQIAGSDDSYLCDDNLTLKGALEEDEKKLGRKVRKAARQDEGSDENDDEKDDFDLMLEENMDNDEEDNNKYIFFASINVSSVYDLDGDFEADNCPKPMAGFIINEVSEFCECVSIRLDNGDPCFLVINKDKKNTSYIRINPEPINRGTTAIVSPSIRNVNIKNLLKFK